MPEKENFGDFYAKLCDIINSSFALGTKIDDATVTHNIGDLSQYSHPHVKKVYPHSIFPF